MEESQACLTIPKRYGIAVDPAKRGSRPKVSSDLSQAREVQKLAFRVVQSLEEDLGSATDAKSRMSVAVAIRSAIQAWDLARDAARIARNRPLPGSLRPEAVAKRGKKAAPSTFTEIAPAQSVAPPSGGDQKS